MKKILKENLPYIFIIIIILLIRQFLVTPIRVSGSSMDKTLSDGEIMILYKQGHIDREDIVVIDKSVEGSYIIKRVIAMPGEKIKCEDNTIYINGDKYADEFAFGQTFDFEEITLKNDEYFVLGDNRLVSKDSRYFGPINSKNIMGTTNFVLFPFNKIGIVK